MSIKLKPRQKATEPGERTVSRAVRGLRYGSREVPVHDGRMVELETNAKEETNE